MQYRNPVLHSVTYLCFRHWPIGNEIMILLTIIVTVVDCYRTLIVSEVIIRVNVKITCVSYTVFHRLLTCCYCPASSPGGGSLLNGLYRYVQPPMVRFSAVLVINRILILVFVFGFWVWFLHSIPELGMFFFTTLKGNSHNNWLIN